MKGAFKGTNAGDVLTQATLTDGAFHWNNNRSRDLGGLVCPTLDIPLLVAANNAYKASYNVENPSINLKAFNVPAGEKECFGVRYTYTQSCLSSFYFIFIIFPTYSFVSSQVF